MKHSYLRNLAMQFMPGMTLGMLWQVLADNRFRVDPGCLDRLALLHLSGIYNSVNARFERRDNKAAIQSTVIEHSPILILGSGAAARPTSTICSGATRISTARPCTRPFFPPTSPTANAWAHVSSIISCPRPGPWTM